MSKYKRKQSNIISALKRKNLQLKNDLSEYCLQAPTVTADQREAVKKYNKSIYECANMSLYKQSKDTNIIDFLNAHTCKKKCCAICNFLRQKSLRRKYARWFKDNSYICELRNKKNGSLKYTTQAVFDRKYTDNYDLTAKQPYELMHLTLTVPHTENGFRNEKYYFDQFKAIFKYMRNKSPFWKQYVMGGEYGLEVTGGRWIKKDIAESKGMTYVAERTTAGGKQLVHRKNDDGLHIHLHALLFVKQIRRSRNTLYREILREWNRLTIDENAKREAFTPDQQEAIKRGLAKKTTRKNPEVEAELDAFVSKLNPKGATFLNIETVFSIDKETGEKIRIGQNGEKADDKAIMMALLEAISYHFEPMALQKDSKEIDIPLLVELLPETDGLRMYEKFDCLYGDKSLNVRDDGNTLVEEYEDVVELLVDEETGELSPENEYFICNPAYVYHKSINGDNIDKEIILSHKAKKAKIRLKAQTTTQAVKEMSDRVRIYRKQFKN